MRNQLTNNKQKIDSEAHQDIIKFQIEGVASGQNDTHKVSQEHSSRHEYNKFDKQMITHRDNTQTYSNINSQYPYFKGFHKQRKSIKSLKDEKSHHLSNIPEQIGGGVSTNYQPISDSQQMIKQNDKIFENSKVQSIKKKNIITDLHLADADQYYLLNNKYLAPYNSNSPMIDDIVNSAMNEENKVFKKDDNLIQSFKQSKNLQFEAEKKSSLQNSRILIFSRNRKRQSLNSKIRSQQLGNEEYDIRIAVVNPQINQQILRDRQEFYEYDQQMSTFQQNVNLIPQQEFGANQFQSGENQVKDNTLVGKIDLQNVELQEKNLDIKQKNKFLDKDNFQDINQYQLGRFNSSDSLMNPYKTQNMDQIKTKVKSFQNWLAGNHLKNVQKQLLILEKEKSKNALKDAYKLKTLYDLSIMSNDNQHIQNQQLQNQQNIHENIEQNSQSLRQRRISQNANTVRQFKSQGRPRIKQKANIINNIGGNCELMQSGMDGINQTFLQETELTVLQVNQSLENIQKSNKNSLVKDTQSKLQNTINSFKNRSKQDIKLLKQKSLQNKKKSLQRDLKLTFEEIKKSNIQVGLKIEGHQNIKSMEKINNKLILEKKNMEESILEAYKMKTQSRDSMDTMERTQRDSILQSRLENMKPQKQNTFMSDRNRQILNYSNQSYNNKDKEIIIANINEVQKYQSISIKSQELNNQQNIPKNGNQAILKRQAGASDQRQQESALSIKNGQIKKKKQAQIQQVYEIQNGGIIQGNQIKIQQKINLQQKLYQKQEKQQQMKQLEQKQEEIMIKVNRIFEQEIGGENKQTSRRFIIQKQQIQDDKQFTKLVIQVPVSEPLQNEKSSIIYDQNRDKENNIQIQQLTSLKEDLISQYHQKDTYTGKNMEGFKSSYQDNVNSKYKIFDDSMNEEESVQFQINGVNCLINKSNPLTKNKKEDFIQPYFQKLNPIKY